MDSIAVIPELVDCQGHAWLISRYRTAIAPALYLLAYPRFPTIRQAVQSMLSSRFWQWHTNLFQTTRVH